MLFNSLSFLIFFPICIAVYYSLPKKARAYWLLLCSAFFYLKWNVVYGSLLGLSIVSAYTCAILIDRQKKKLHRQLTLTAALIVNFGMLFVFKYFDFFIDTINKVIKAPSGGGFSLLNLLLPVGISFYIFQAVGYVIDVYRGEKPEKNFVKFALFVSFFPQLVAGPIERSGNLLKQIRSLDEKSLFNKDDFIEGVLIMIYGFFMKLMIADRASILVSTVFDPEKYSTFSGFEVILAAVLFSVQIYCDFAGYTYIAIGAARVMGFKLCDNFNTPYLAENIKDFWDRWHISLSTWFRDYLYFPLGGSRKGPRRRFINIFIVFLVSGLWHGASWHFVVWGIMHGIFRILHEILAPKLEKVYVKTGYNYKSFSHRLLKIICNFILVTLAWTFFRAQSIGQAVALIKQMLTGLGLWQLSDGSLYNLGLDVKEMNVLLISIAVMSVVDLLKYKGKNLTKAFLRQNTWFKFVFFYLAIVIIAIFGVYGAKYDASTFIYFQF